MLRRNPANNEEPWATLGRPMHRVEHDDIDGITHIVQCEEGLFEVAARVTHKKPEHILQQDNLGTTVAHLSQDPHKPPKRRGLLALQSLPSPGNRKVIAGERRGDEFTIGNLRGVKFVYV